MTTILELITLLGIILFIVLKLISKRIGLMLSRNLQLLALGCTLLLISMNTVSMVYRFTCIILGIYNIVNSITNILKNKKDITDITN